MKPNFLFNIDQFPDVIIIRDGKTIKKVNSEFSFLFGYGEGEIVGKSIETVIVSDNQFFNAEKEINIFNNKNFSATGKLKDGTAVSLEVRSKRVSIEGKFYSFDSIRSVNKENVAEEKIRISEERHKFALAATKEGLWDWNLITNELYLSPSWKMILGYKDDELKNEFATFKKLTLEEDFERVFKVFNDYLAGNTDSYELEFRMKHKDGSFRHILARAYAYYDPHGKAIRAVGTHRDITKEKELLNALNESELRWKFAVEGNKDGLWDWNLITNEVFFSPQWKAMLGFDENEIESNLEEWEKRVHPEDLENVYTDIKKCLNGETENYYNEHRVLCKDGAYKWVLDRGKILEYTEDGKPKRMIGTHTDIHYRKTIEEKLSEQQDELIKLTENIPGVIYQYQLLNDGSSRFPFATKSIWDIYEVFPEEVKNDASKVFTRIHPEDLDIVIDSIHKSAQTMEVWQAEYRVKLPEKGTRWLRGTSKPEKMEDGSVLWHGYIHDVTDRKLAEEAVKKSKESYKALAEKYKQVMATANEGIHILDGGGNLVEANDYFYNYLGYSPEELIGKNVTCWDKRWSEEELDGIMSKLLNSPATFTTIHQTKNGKIIDVEVNAFGIKLSDKTFLYCASRDISERIDAERKMEKYIEDLQAANYALEDNSKALIDLNEKLAESERALQELNADKDRFFSIISHDLRSPFAGLIGSTELLKELVDNHKNDEMKELVDICHFLVRKTLALLEDLLTWAKIQNGRMEINPENFDISETINFVTDLTKLQAQDKKIDMITNVEENLIGYADERSLNAILRNLINNAIKFTESEGKVTINAVREKEFILISIIDNGVGMEEEVKENLFRIDKNHTTLGTNNEKGSGLGLILCKELVEKNGGKIWVESEKGKGSKFTFSIPSLK